MIDQRENGRIASEAIALHAAATAVMSPEGGSELFRSMIDKLTGD